MKMNIIKLILLILLLTIVILVYRYNSLKPPLVNTIIDSNYELYTNGSEQDIREHLDKDGSTIKQSAFIHIIKREKNDILEMLLKEYEINPDIGSKYYSSTPLIYAVKELKVTSVELLIKYGADVNYLNRHGQTPLIIVSDFGVSPSSYEKTSILKITKLLIESGADVNIISKRNQTALGGASIANDLDRIKYLVENGANTMIMDKSESNYLFYCSELDCIRFFIEQGLDINSINIKGANLIQNAVSNSWRSLEFIKGLVDLGINICHEDNSGNNVLNYSEKRDINPHLKKDNPDFFNKKVAENKVSETYKYLEKEYNKKCLKIK